MNYALHTIAVTHERGVGPGQAYLATAEARGKDRLAAPRLLRRRLSAIYCALRADQIPPSTMCSGLLQSRS